MMIRILNKKERILPWRRLIAQWYWLPCPQDNDESLLFPCTGQSGPARPGYQPEYLTQVCHRNPELHVETGFTNNNKNQMQHTHVHLKELKNYDYFCFRRGWHGLVELDDFGIPIKSKVIKDYKRPSLLFLDKIQILSDKQQLCTVQKSLTNYLKSVVWYWQRTTLFIK